MRRVYLIHNFEARDWLRENVVPKIEAVGYKITSGWVVEADPPSENQEGAVMCLEDLRRADSVILFAKQYGHIPGRGKYVEFGFALATAKRCIVVVPPGSESMNCVFYHLPNVRVVADVESAIPLI